MKRFFVMLLIISLSVVNAYSFSTNKKCSEISDNETMRNVIPVLLAAEILAPIGYTNYQMVEDKNNTFLYVTDSIIILSLGAYLFAGDSQKDAILTAGVMTTWIADTGYSIFSLINANRNNDRDAITRGWIGFGVHAACWTAAAYTLMLLAAANVPCIEQDYESMLLPEINQKYAGLSWRIRF